MAREIKFRAWHKGAKEIYEVATINFEDSEIGLYIKDGSGNVGYLDLGDIELMQFIGLRDNHNAGKEIYKADIVRVTSIMDEVSIGEVVWDEENAQFAVDVGYDVLTFEEINHCDQRVEVLGNSHKNPELLEEG